MKLFDRGEPNKILMQIVRTNVRQPDEVIGDFYAQTSCNETGGRALREMMDEFDLDSIDEVSEEIIRRSEAAVRAEIAKLPDGEWYERDLERRFRGADPDPLHGARRRRRNLHRLHRLVAAKQPRNQCRVELHSCLRELRDQGGDLSRRAA